MSTTSTAPAVLDALLTAINADLTDVTAYEVWPGPEASYEMVVLGEITWDEYEIATVMRPRLQRDEVYDIAFAIFVAGGAGDIPSDPSTARDRAFEVLESLENVLANDPYADVDDVSVKWIKVRPEEATAVAFETAWAYRITGSVNVSARLL